MDGSTGYWKRVDFSGLDGVDEFEGNLADHSVYGNVQHGAGRDQYVNAGISSLWFGFVGDRHSLYACCAEPVTFSVPEPGCCCWNNSDLFRVDHQ